MQYRKIIKNDYIGQHLFYIVMVDKQSSPAWFYVHVNKTKITAFKKALGQQVALNLKEWGDIVESGFGEASPEYIRLAMKQKYKFQHKEFNIGCIANVQTEESYFDS